MSKRMRLAKAAKPAAINPVPEKTTWWTKSKKRLVLVSGIVAAVATFVTSSGAIIEFCTNLFSKKGVKLVEISIDTNNVMDIKVRNTSKEIVYIKKIELIVKKKWRIDTDANTYYYLQESTGSYDLNIDSSITVPATVSKTISQAIAPGSTDRFQVTLHSSASFEQSLIYQFDVNILYDEDDKSVGKKDVLCAFELELQKYKLHKAANNIIINAIDGAKTESYNTLVNKVK